MLGPNESGLHSERLDLSKHVVAKYCPAQTPAQASSNEIEQEIVHTTPIVYSGLHGETDDWIHLNF